MKVIIFFLHKISSIIYLYTILCVIYSVYKFKTKHLEYKYMWFNFYTVPEGVTLNTWLTHYIVRVLKAKRFS